MTLLEEIESYYKKECQTADYIGLSSFWRDRVEWLIQKVNEHEAQLAYVSRLQEIAAKRVKELEAELSAADEGMLKASDPKNPWQGIHAECKGWKDRAEKAEAELARIRAMRENVALVENEKS